MAIMALSLSLVLPLTVDQVESARKRAEREKVVLFLRQATQNAFYYSEPVNVTVSGKRLTADYQNREQAVLETTYLTFEEQKFVLFALGPSIPTTLTAVISGNRWPLEVSREKITWLNPD